MTIKEVVLIETLTKLGETIDNTTYYGSGQLCHIFEMQRLFSDLNKQVVEFVCTTEDATQTDLAGRQGNDSRVEAGKIQSSDRVSGQLNVDHRP